MSETLGIHEGLYKNGYANIVIDTPASELAEVIEHYEAFLSLDEPIHETTRYFNTERGDGDFGQFERVAKTEGARGETPDTKDIFHFGANSRQVIESRIHGALPQDLKRFLDNTEALFWSSERAKKRALAELDWTKAGLLDIMCSERGTNNDVLRLISYREDPNNQGVLAKGHFDRGVCTLAIGESHEGLNIAPGQNGLVEDCDMFYMHDLEAYAQPVLHQDGQAKFFLGAGWNRLPERYQAGNHDLPLGWHNVRETPTRVNDKVLRWAIVRFCNPIIEFVDYTVPTPPETRPYKQLGRLSVEALA